MTGNTGPGPKAIPFILANDGSAFAAKTPGVTGQLMPAPAPDWLVVAAAAGLEEVPPTSVLWHDVVSVNNIAATSSDLGLIDFR
jgi:hypothetical protein